MFREIRKNIKIWCSKYTQPVLLQTTIFYQGREHHCPLLHHYKMLGDFSYLEHFSSESFIQLNILGEDGKYHKN